MAKIFSPYHKLPTAKWQKKTQELIESHPLSITELVDVVLQSWKAIFESKIGPHEFQIGKQLFPVPQIMGFFLHELIALELTARHEGEWRGDQTADEKDLVYILDAKFSIEIKTSSHKTKVFGNRSYAQAATTDWKKSKSGYYLAVNFEKFTKADPIPNIRLVRFGWLDHTDWIGQTSATGQQAHLDPLTDRVKLLEIYPNPYSKK
jgi:hypothetical protein